MEQKTQQEHRVTFLTNMAYWIVILAIVYFVLKYFLNLVMPLFIALILAALARPIAKFLSAETREKKKPDGTVSVIPRKASLPYNIAAIIAVIIVFIIVLGVITIIVAPLITFLTDMVVQVPDVYYNSVQPDVEYFFMNIEGLYSRLDDSLVQILQDSVPNLVSSLGSVVTNATGKVIGWLSSIAGSLPTMLLNGIICLIAAFFFAIDFDSISEFITLNLRSSVLEMVIDIKDSLVSIVWQFIRSYFLIFLITAAEITVGLLIIGTNRPLLIGVLIAIFDAFPIVGSGMILLPWSIITMITAGFWRGLALFVLYLIVVIVRQFIEPKIVGKHVGLRPIITLSCMYVGTQLFGGIGLFALPIAAAIITDLNESGTVNFFKTRRQALAEEIISEEEERSQENDASAEADDEN